MNIYSLINNWYNFVGDNGGKIKIQHHAVYFYAIFVCNKNGWAKEFIFPSESGLTFTSVRTYKTYISALNDLVAFGFLNLINKSKNQHSANIVALVDFTKATTKASTKALYNAEPNQVVEQDQRNSSIYRLIYNRQIDQKTKIRIFIDFLEKSNSKNKEEFFKEILKIKEFKDFLNQNLELIKLDTVQEKEKSSAKKEKDQSEQNTSSNNKKIKNGEEDNNPPKYGRHITPKLIQFAENFASETTN